MAVALGGAGEVGMQAAAGGADIGGGTAQQTGAAELEERGEAVAGRAALVDVQDVGSGGAGGDGQVPAGAAAEPGGDLTLVGGGVAVAVPGCGGLLPRRAREHRPAAAGVAEGVAQGGAGHGVLRG